MVQALGSKAAAFSEANVKKTSNKVNDSLREKPPKSLGDDVYCCAYWSVLQDLAARVMDQNAAWLSNGGNMERVRLPLSLSLSLLLTLLTQNESVILNRVEFASLLQYLVGIEASCDVAAARAGIPAEGEIERVGDVDRGAETNESRDVEVFRSAVSRGIGAERAERCVEARGEEEAEEL